MRFFLRFSICLPFVYTSNNFLSRFILNALVLTSMLREIFKIIRRMEFSFVIGGCVVVIDDDILTELTLAFILAVDTNGIVKTLY